MSDLIVADQQTPHEKRAKTCKPPRTLSPEVVRHLRAAYIALGSPKKSGWVTSIAKSLGVSHSTVSRAINGDLKKYRRLAPVDKPTSEALIASIRQTTAVICEMTVHDLIHRAQGRFHPSKTQHRARQVVVRLLYVEMLWHAAAVARVLGITQPNIPRLALKGSQNEEIGKLAARLMLALEVAHGKEWWTL